MKKQCNRLGFKIGIPTLLEHSGPEAAVYMCAELGLDFVELNMNIPCYIPENLSAEHILNIQNEYGVFFTLHFPEKIDFGAFSATMRDSSVKLFKEACSFAESANIKLINVHIDEGVYLTMPNEKIWLYEKYTDEFVANVTDSFTKMAKIAKNKKVILCVENTVFPGFLEQVFTKLAEVNNVNFTWDIGHDAQNSYRFSRFTDRNKIGISHFHIHDFDGISSHQTLFSGVLDIEGAFDSARINNASVVIEVKTQNELTNSIIKLRNKGII